MIFIKTLYSCYNAKQDVAASSVLNGKLKFFDVRAYYSSAFRQVQPATVPSAKVQGTYICEVDHAPFVPLVISRLVLDYSMCFKYFQEACSLEVYLSTYIYIIQ